MKQRLKQSLYALVMVVLLGLLAWLFLPAPFEVEVAAAQRGDLALSIADSGAVRARDRFLVKAPVAAQLGAIGLRMGERVSAGQPIARMSPRSLTGLEKEEHIARIRAMQVFAARALAEVDVAREAMEAAQREELREAELFAVGGHSREKHEAAKLNLARAAIDARAAAFRADAAAGELRVAEFALTLGEDSGRVLDIFSPVEGVVSKVFQKNPSLVQAGAPLIEISDASRLEVVVPVPVSEAVKLSRGMTLLIENAPGQKPLALRVREIDSVPFAAIGAHGGEEQRVNVKADLVPGAPFADGANVSVRIVQSAKTNVLKVPASSLVQMDKGWAVFTVIGNQARKIEVIPGLRNAAEAEIISGVEVDTPVVVNPPPGLKEGSRLAPFRRGG